MSVPAVHLRGLILSLLLVSSASAQPPSVIVRQPHVDVGRAVRGAVLQPAFTLTNGTAAPLRIKTVTLTPPLLPGDFPSEIPAHAETVLKLKLDTRTLAGAYEGEVIVSFADPAIENVRLTVSGNVVPTIEVVPPVIIAAAERGEQKQATVEIVNHEAEPVLISRPLHSTERFTTMLETVDEGRRFRLTLSLNPDGPSGKGAEPIVLKTSSAAMPEVKIAAYTHLRERVYTFPDSVEVGVLRLDEIRRSPDVLTIRAQTLMVYRKGTSDFQATVSTDVPQLAVSAERGPLGDRYQITISVAADHAIAGPIRGHIVIETNDPEFPKLAVPVSGQIVGGP